MKSPNGRWDGGSIVAGIHCHFDGFGAGHRGIRQARAGRPVLGRTAAHADVADVESNLDSGLTCLSLCAVLVIVLDPFVRFLLKILVHIFTETLIDVLVINIIFWQRFAFMHL